MVVLVDLSAKHTVKPLDLSRQRAHTPLELSTNTGLLVQSCLQLLISHLPVSKLVIFPCYLSFQNIRIRFLGSELIFDGLCPA